MVTTRSDTNRGSRNTRNVREERNSNDPQITLLNERMEQMAKSIEDLANLNAILQARISEHSWVATENQEARNNVDSKRHEEEVHESSRVEGTGERLENRGHVPGDLPPSQTNAERAMHGMINQLEQRCNVLTAAIQCNDKGKASLVEDLLQKTASPFIEEVAGFSLPEKFKVLDVTFYTGLEDPLEHLENICAHIDLHRTPKKVACRAFPLTLSGNARDWFQKLPPNPINDFDQLSKMFLMQFMAGWVRRKPTGSLMSLHQGAKESLKKTSL